MINWIKPKNWGIVKVYRDFENFLDWIRAIKREESNKKSKFNLWKLNRTKLYDIFTIISLQEVDAVLPEDVKKVKVLESLNPLNRYFDEELGFAECLNIDFNQFFDDDNKPTLSYLIVYRFNFSKFSILWLIKFLIKMGIIFAVIKFNIIPILIDWVNSLM